jgi:hypothetical protein
VLLRVVVFEGAEFREEGDHGRGRGY